MLEFRVPEIHCDSCIRALTGAVRELDSDAILQADLTSKQVRVETIASGEAVANAIREAGFDIDLS